METVNVIDPSTGQAHAIPYDQLPNALQAGGQFADEEQKQKAISIQDGTYGQSQIPSAGMQPQKHERLGWKGLAEDTVNMLRGALKGGMKFGADIPNKLKKSGKYIEENPISSIFHNLGQMGAGAAELAKSGLNLPHEALAELGRKELIPEWLKKYNELPFTHIPEDTGVENALGLKADPEKGDELVRALPAIAPTAIGAVRGLGKGIKLAQAPSKATLKIRGMERAIDEAKEAHNLSEEAVNQLKDSLKLQYSKNYKGELGELSPVDQLVNINKKTNKAEELLTKANAIPEKHVGEIPEPPDTRAMIQERKKVAEQARKEAEEALGVLDHPSLKGGAIVKKAITDVKNSSSNLYDAARKHYIDQNILADNSAEIKTITSDLQALKDADELAPGYGSGTSEQKTLESQLESLQGEQVKASDVFDLQRTLEKMAKDTRKKQYSGVSEIEFKRLNGLADRLEGHADKLATRLEAVGGKDVQGMIREANKGWKTFKELEKNSTARPALKKGELPSRAMINIANTENGNEFLRALTETYPELKKHLLAAHVGETNVNKLLNPTSLTKKYLQALPGIEEKVQDLKHAIAGVKEGQSQASGVKREYDALVASMKEAANQQKIRQDTMKKVDELRKQIAFHKDAIPKLNASIKVANQKGQEHAKLDKELKEHKQEIQDKNYLLKKLGNSLLKITGASSLLHKVGL